MAPSFATLEVPVRLLSIIAFASLAAAGCGDDDVTPGMDAGGMVDGGTMRVDGGRRDSGPVRTDGGPADPCAASDSNPETTVGCNGDLIGPGAADNEFGGRCTPDPAEMDPAGSCTDTNAYCWADVGATEGICLELCEPGGTYVTTGGCPAGARCFTFDTDYALCFADCTMDSDCSTNNCDGEGSCVEPTGSAMDGGTPDGGPSTDGGPAPDGGPPTDGGPAPDAAAPADGGPALDATAATDGGPAPVDAGPG